MPLTAFLILDSYGWIRLRYLESGWVLCQWLWMVCSLLCSTIVFSKVTSLKYMKCSWYSLDQVFCLCSARNAARTAGKTKRERTTKSKIIFVIALSLNRSEKVTPFIVFLVCSLISMTVAGYGMYVIIELNSNYSIAKCNTAIFAESLFNT